MSTQYTSERYNAITKMIKSGESVLYSCGMFDTPVSFYQQWLGGLSGPSIQDTGENNVTITPAKEVYNTPTKGHLQGSGGIRGHSAGDIFPLIIVAVGTFKLGFSYHIIGNGLKIGQSIWASYEVAHKHAVADFK